MPMMTGDDPNEQYLSPGKRPAPPQGVDPGIWRGDKPSVPLAEGAGEAAGGAMSSGTQHYNSHANDMKPGAGSGPTLSARPMPQPGGGSATSGGPSASGMPPMAPHFPGGPAPTRANVGGGRGGGPPSK